MLGTNTLIHAYKHTQHSNTLITREKEKGSEYVLHLHTRCPKNLEIQYQRSYSLFDSNRWQKKMKIN